MKNKFLTFLNFVLVLTTFITLTSCNNNGNKSKIENVNIRMKWFYAGTMSGWFAGKEKGFFSDEGINLTINSGGPDNNAVKLVAAGTDQFGIASADEVLLARSKGIPIIAIAVLFKDNPICFISKKQSGINTINDWSNKTIEVSYGDNSEVQYRALLKKYNLTGIKEVPYTFNLIPFIENKVDVSVAYIMDQVLTLQQKGIDLNVFKPKDSEINPYGDVIITSEKFAKENPELIKKFIKASKKSQLFAIENPDESVRYFINSNSTLKFENELNIWKSTIPFIIGDDKKEDIFKMQLSRWQYCLDILKQFNLIKSEVVLENSFINTY